MGLGKGNMGGTAEGPSWWVPGAGAAGEGAGSQWASPNREEPQIGLSVERRSGVQLARVRTLEWFQQPILRSAPAPTPASRTDVEQMTVDTGK